MKSLITVTTVAVILACGMSYAQSPSYEHLKGFDPMIGRWVYEGPCLEDVPDVAKKGSELVIRFHFRRILDKSVVEQNWSIEYESGVKASGKGLTCWDAATERIVWGGMDSTGGHNLGTVSIDTAAKTSTLNTEGVDSDGKRTEFTGVITFKDKNTITWHAPYRKGGIVEGPGPTYTLKR